MITRQDIIESAQLGDPEADRVVAELLDNGEVGDVNDLFRTVGRMSAPNPQLPDRLREFLHEAAAEPAGWTEDDVHRAERFFDHHHFVASMLQGTVGLIGCYLSPAGAFTLHSTHRLDRPRRRLSQSTRLFMGMGDRGALRNGSLATTVTKVRLVHASVRQLHKRSGEWDYETWGEPVSQKYTAGAGFVFSAGVLDGMRNLGIEVSDEDADGFCAAWHYVLHYLGTPEHLLVPKTAEEAHAVMDRERDHEWRRSDDGVLMTRNAIEFYQELLPPGFSDAFVSMVRQALGDRYADMVDIPTSPVDLGTAAATTANGVFSAASGFFGGAVKPVAPNPMEEILGVAGKAFERVVREAITHDQDTEPQMHADLHDGN